MKITTVEVGIYSTNCYIVEGDDFCLLIDPGDNWDLICSNIQKDVTFVVLTHAHFDHILALNSVLKTYPKAKLCYSPLEKTDGKTISSIASLCNEGVSSTFSIPHADIPLSEGTDICSFKVLSTPGHTSGSICLYNEQEGLLFSGDTLFHHGFGRTDLGGSRQDIITSLKYLFTLPPQTKVFPGHGEPTTIGSEKTYYKQ